MSAPKIEGASCVECARLSPAGCDMGFWRTTYGGDEVFDEWGQQSDGAHIKDVLELVELNHRRANACKSYEPKHSQAVAA